MRFPNEGKRGYLPFMAFMLLFACTLVGCKPSPPTVPSATAPGISNPYVEDYYQIYLQSPEAKVGKRGNHWARVAVSLSPTMNPNKVTAKQAVHYLGNPDFVKTDQHGTSFAYLYVEDAPIAHGEVILMDFDDGGNLLQVAFTNQEGYDFSGCSRRGATTQATH